MYCQKCEVTITASQHQCVDAKVCATCGEEKSIKEFPVHPSSFDGHWHNCSGCVEKEKERNKAYRAQVRIRAVQQRIERKSRTEQENAIFRTYGYYWKKEMVEAYEDWEEAWVLHTPASAQISPRMRCRRLPGCRYTSLVILARSGRMISFLSLIHWC